MPPVCCRCNGNGTCSNCKCARSGRSCNSCAPSRQSRCANPWNVLKESVASSSCPTTAGCSALADTSKFPSDGLSANLPPKTSSTSSLPSSSTGSSAAAASDSGTLPVESLGVVSGEDPIETPRDIDISYPRVAGLAPLGHSPSASSCSISKDPTGGDDGNDDSATFLGEVVESALTSEIAANLGDTSPVQAEAGAEANYSDHPAQNRPSVTPSLPACSPAPPATFTWCTEPGYCDVDGATFCELISSAYSETKSWRRNLFLVPSGSSGKAFVSEMARLFEAFAFESALEGIALKAAMTAPSLLLQKPSAKSKAKDHSECLARRLTLWKRGRISELLSEGRTIQKHLPTKLGGIDDDQRLAKSFARLMTSGNTRAALRLLSTKGVGGPLNLPDVIEDTTGSSKTVEKVLEEKHPPAQPATAASLLPDLDLTDLDPVHPVLFERITEVSIRSAALHTEGGAGPSGIDALGWRRLCCSFGRVSTDLCRAVASTARRLCTSLPHPSSLDAYTACRLIALNKLPGVRPIGVCEVVRRIIGKAVMEAIKPDIVEAAGSLQLCAGQQAGAEAAIHALRELFEHSSTEGMLLVDAKNAFNSLNREAALLNIHSVCPPLASILTNCYRVPSALYTTSGKVLWSREGTTQGDPLGMAMYAMAVMPLIHRLQDRNAELHQIWFADDSAGASYIIKLRKWFDDLQEHGPHFGYYVNPAKCWLVTKVEQYDLAVKVFEGTGVQVSSEGRPYLGAGLGTRGFVENFVKSRVSGWREELVALCRVAQSQPHAAFAALTHGVLSKWTYLQRTVPGVGHLFQPLEDILRSQLLPALTGQSAPGDLLRRVLALPARHGGLGIQCLISEADQAYDSSRKISAPLCAAICLQSRSAGCTTAAQLILKKEVSKDRWHRLARLKESLSSEAPPNLHRAIHLGSERGASVWLTALPIESRGFWLHKGDFRDALCLRYNWPLKRLPSKCVCTEALTVEHALSCPRGGFPTLRHNDVRNITASLLSEVSSNVAIEPPLQPLSGEQLRLASAITDEGARLDIAAEGFWGSPNRAFFDVRVFNPFARSNSGSTLAAVYRKHEKEKLRAYEQRVIEIEHGSFTPLILSAAGGMAPLAARFYRRLADKLADKWDCHFSIALCLIRCQLSFSLLRSAIRCLRGFRSSSRHPAHATVTDHADVVMSEARLCGGSDC